MIKLTPGDHPEFTSDAAPGRWWSGPGPMTFATNLMQLSHGPVGQRRMPYPFLSAQFSVIELPSGSQNGGPKPAQHHSTLSQTFSIHDLLLVHDVDQPVSRMIIDSDSP